MAKIRLAAPSEDADAEEVRRRLRALIQELNYVLNNLDEENMSEGYNRRTAKKGAQN